MKNLRYLAVIVSATLVGCVSQPKHVEASRPLVETATVSQGIVLSQSWQDHLNSVSSGLYATDNGSYLVSKTYVSAHGNVCRKVSKAHISSEDLFRVVCIDEGAGNQWYLTKSIGTSDMNEEL